MKQLGAAVQVFLQIVAIALMASTLLTVAANHRRINESDKQLRANWNRLEADKQYFEREIRVHCQ